MFNENRYDKVKDITTIPCAVRLNGEKAIAISGKFAFVQYADGMMTYYKRDQLHDWELIRTEVCTNA